MNFTYARQVGNAVATSAGFGGNQTIYSASFTTIVGQQD